jgi:serine protease Do
MFKKNRIISFLLVPFIILATTNSVNAINISESQTTARLTNNSSLPNFTNLVKKVGNTVVNINAEVTIDGSNPELDQFFELFRQFGGQIPNLKPKPQVRLAMGSGFIISQDGYILTNAHVVNGARKIIVKTTDKQEFKAKLIGLDSKTDIALLKVEAINLPFVKIGNPNDLEVGEWVAAIGAPFGFTNSVTQGIISAKGRNLPDDSYVPFIQSDVPVNPGNSGGPLFNLNGEVVGINSQIYSRSGGYMGISFSIPIDIAMNIVSQIKQYGHASHGQLGVQIQPVTKDVAKNFGLNSNNGALIAQVIKNSAASISGVKVGDIITKIDGQLVTDAMLLPSMIASKKPKDVVVLEIYRNHRYINIRVILADSQSNDKPNPVKSNNNDKKSSLDIKKFGFSISNLSTDDRKQLHILNGVRIIDTKEDGVAKLAGLQTGDIILSINNQSVSDLSLVSKLVMNKNNITLLILRGDMQMFVSLSTN